MFLEWKISIMHAFLLVKSMWWKNKLASIKGFELKNMLSHMMSFFPWKCFEKVHFSQRLFFYYKPWRIIWLLNCKNTLIVTNFLTYLFIVSSFYFCNFFCFYWENRLHWEHFPKMIIHTVNFLVQRLIIISCFYR